ncbi:UNVERIFIED_ORG: AAA domain-containing protein [Gordonia westfalica J30]
MTNKTDSESTSDDGHDNGSDDGNPFDGPERQAKTERERAEAVALQRRVEKWGGKRYAVEHLAGVSAPWARKVVGDAARDDLRRKLSDEPTLMVGGDKLVNAGATDAEIAALRALTDSERWDLRIRAGIAAADVRAQIAEGARELASARGAAALDIPDPINLTTYTPSETVWLIDGLVPAAGSLGLFAERKAGKTTTVVEIVRSLLSGDKFLGRFDTHLDAAARVVLLDTEMTADMLHHEYTVTAGCDDLDRLDLWCLRGQSRVLDMRAEAARARWRQRIAPGSVIIVDCLYTVLRAANIDEASSEVSSVIGGFTDLGAECGAAGVVLVHHLGKDPSKGARGHSSIEGGVDTIATIWLDGPPAAATPRVFSANGRYEVDVPAARLTREDGRLTLSESPGGPGASRAASRVEARLSDVLDALAEADGEMTKTKVRAAVGGKATTTDDALDLGLKRKQIAVRYVGRAQYFSIRPAAADPMHVGDPAPSDVAVPA